MIKKHTQAPIVVGFGIRDTETADRALNLGADAVIVGSRLIEEMGKGLEVGFTFIDKMVGGIAKGMGK